VTIHIVYKEPSFLEQDLLSRYDLDEEGPGVC
jgi:hypothetical protein